MGDIASNPDDKDADKSVSGSRIYNAMLRTTCVATTLAAGHATNALPQRATANINCRLIPGDSTEGVRGTLVKAIGNPSATVTALPPVRPVADPPTIDPAVSGSFAE